MRNDEAFETLFATLRSLAATDPRRARDSLIELLDSNSPYVDQLLQKASQPGEGRVRQLVANTARARGEQSRFASYLRKWQRVESDEFTKRALDAALHGTRPAEPEPAKSPSLVDRAHLEAYRYVNDRLNHQLRNALMEPMSQLIQLRGELGSITDESLRGALAARIGALADSLSAVGQVVEFRPDDDFFEMRDIEIDEWLDAFNADYARRFQPVSLTLHMKTTGARISASGYLLRNIFWNLWVNSQQAVGTGCAIAVHISCSADTVDLLIADNGDGFASEIGEAGFPGAKPREGHRGRGLLEVQEAVERLHGAAGMVRHADGTFRVTISFPKARQ